MPNTTLSTQKALSIQLNTPDWCWNKPRKDGSQTWRINKYTEMADKLKWCARRHLETCLEKVGIDMISASGGCCDFVYSADIDDDFVYHHIACALGASRRNGCYEYPDYDFNLVEVSIGYEGDLSLPSFGCLYDNMKPLSQVVPTAEQN